MEESEVCSLPGGFASLRKQFETQETTHSHSAAQFHFQQRTVQVRMRADGMTAGNKLTPADAPPLRFARLFVFFKVVQSLLRISFPPRFLQNASLMTVTGSRGPNKAIDCLFLIWLRCNASAQLDRFIVISSPSVIIHFRLQ